MGAKRILTRVLVSIAFWGFTLLFSTCGGGRQPTLQSGAPDVLVGAKGTPKTDLIQQRLDTGVIQGGDGKSVALVVDVLKELDALQAPANVEASVFSELKDELYRQLTAKGASKLVSKPPTGEKNRVDDLTLTDNGDGTFTLTWTYKNVGDYDQNGIVAIADITPLAEHFQETAEGEGDSFRGWIDGNADGIINIQDITPIAENFFSQVWEYVIEGASLTTPGDFSEFARVSFVTTNKEQRGTASLTFSADDAGLLTTFRVVPVDYENNRGEVSNEVSLPVSAPIIYSVTPTQGFKNEAYTFTANVSGTRPLSYQWDFGGGANPSLFPSPPGGADVVTAEVTLADTPGDYSALLTVTNQYGEDTYSFTLTVQAREVWVHTWGGSGSESARDLVFDDEGNIYILGRTNSPEFTAGANKEDDLLLLKYSPHGEVLWARTWGGEKSEKAVGIHLAPDGNLVVAGQTNSFGAGRDDVLLLKYNLDGNLIFQKTWGTADLYERVNGSCIDELGNIYIVGYTIAYGSSSTDLLIGKFDLDGNSVWARRLMTSSEAEVSGISISPLGEIYVSGSIDGTGGLKDGLAVRFRVDGEFVQAIAVDAGFSEGLGGNPIFQSDGVLLLSGGYRNQDTEDRFGLFIRTLQQMEVTEAWSVPGSIDPLLLEGGKILALGYVGEVGNWQSLLVGYDKNLQTNFVRLWNGTWTFLNGLAKDDFKNFFAFGYSRDAIGSWSEQSMVQSAPLTYQIYPTVVLPESLQEFALSIEGVVSSPLGTLDQGGGEIDILVIKNLTFLEWIR